MGLIPERKKVLAVPRFEDLHLLIFGRQGAGKTSFCNGDPDTVTIAAEPGSDFVETRDVKTRDWVTFQRVVMEVHESRKSHPHDISAVVIDIVDNLYEYCSDHICQRLKIAHPSDKKDFGKSWAEITKEWTGWLTSLYDVVSLRFITHQVEVEEERENELGLDQKYTCLAPRFSSNRGAKFLDGIVSAVGHMYVNKRGQHCITFKQNARCAAKDRTGILCELGEIVLPDKKTDGFRYVSELYANKAKEMGFLVKRRFENYG